jgi:hypothetical protein
MLQRRPPAMTEQADGGEQQTSAPTLQHCVGPVRTGQNRISLSARHLLSSEEIRMSLPSGLPAPGHLAFPLDR